MSLNFDKSDSVNMRDLKYLVIAARKAFDTFTLPVEEQRNLDAALEKFSCLVPYDEDIETEIIAMKNQEAPKENPVCPICKGFSAFDQCSCHYE